jgi:hypothetical protein
MTLFSETLLAVGGLVCSCQAKCVAYHKPCYAWSWCGTCGGVWDNVCFGRLDKNWSLHGVPAAISGNY